MKASEIIYLVNNEDYKTLLSRAEGELFNDILVRNKCITRKQRQKALNAFIRPHTGRHYTWTDGDTQIITDGYIAFFLEDHLRIKAESPPPENEEKKLRSLMRDVPGQQVRVIWFSLHMELELHLGTDLSKKPLYVKVGDAVTSAGMLSAARVILGDEDLRIYQSGAELPLMLIGKNGKALVCTAYQAGIRPENVIDVTAPDHSKEDAA